MSALSSVRSFAALAASGAMLSACAHDPIQPTVSITENIALEGHSWTLTSLAGVGERASPITMDFTESGRVSGSSGCNRYNGEPAISADRLTISRIAGTKMLCIDPVMRSERAFLDFIRNGGLAYEIDGDDLVLTDGAQGQARFVRFDAN